MADSDIERGAAFLLWLQDNIPGEFDATGTQIVRSKVVIGNNDKEEQEICIRAGPPWVQSAKKSGGKVSAPFHTLKIKERASDAVRQVSN